MDAKTQQKLLEDTKKLDANDPAKLADISREPEEGLLATMNDMDATIKQKLTHVSTAEHG
jgi:hypothetical protein